LILPPFAFSLDFPGLNRLPFRTAETTSYPNHIVEMALAHDIGNKVETAYRRGATRSLWIGTASDNSSR
jgi:hypothetical protein